MSWQSYVDDQLLGTGHVHSASIVGLDGSLWATSSNLQLSASEQSAIATAAANPSSVLGGKITLKGENFMVLRADDSAIYCRKGNEGACICKTNQAVIIGIFGENQQAGQCNMVVEKLGDYLREANY
eukprot:CAMPEP_0172151842 /NCGR_PEP_ID=MMETSP1050-20130122/476_1 /TAXON_ID=233186 /ORGANISM="Cryptomonas curvata, Strain CCAP979/52" /LENGTH=126 /DNA_ID=CAMNT_0012820037 /DNA_START=70 /DNA_END=450 /DNA_ORIENTATION=+